VKALGEQHSESRRKASNLGKRNIRKLIDIAGKKELNGMRLHGIWKVRDF